MNPTRLASLASLTLVLLGAASAHAQDAPPPVPPPRVHPQRTVSVTFSPIHLALPVFEVTGEVRVDDKIGIAGILGFGQVTPASGDPVSLFEIGASGRYYALGDFRHGMQVGLEAFYIHASAAADGVTATADGLAVGPFVGYKYTADIGFTFDSQLGFQRFGIGADSSDGQSTEDSDYGVLLNLNVGWSF